MFIYSITEPGDSPANFTVAVINSTAVELTWSEPLLPYGIIVSYTVTYNISGENNISIVVDSSDPQVLIIAQLQEHTWYRFEVFASTRIGDGPYATVTSRTDIAGKYS